MPRLRNREVARGDGVSIRLSQTERDMLDRAATHEGEPSATLARRLLLKALGELVALHEEISI